MKGSKGLPRQAGPFAAGALILVLAVLAGCEITVNDSSSSGKPWEGTTPTQLSYGSWTNKTVAQGGTVWFKFIAKDTTQYIHVSTSVYLNAQLYNSDGIASGSQTYFNGKPDNISRPVNVGATYYLKIWPSSGGCDFGITYNGQSAAPVL